MGRFKPLGADLSFGLRRLMGLESGRYAAWKGPKGDVLYDTVILGLERAGMMLLRVNWGLRELVCSKCFIMTGVYKIYKGFLKLLDTFIS